MKKLLGILVLGLLWCNFAKAEIILSKCYMTKYEDISGSKVDPQEKFNNKNFEEWTYEIDLENKIVSQIVVKTNEQLSENKSKIDSGKYPYSEEMKKGLLRRVSVTSANIIQIDKDIIKAIGNFEESGKWEITLDTKKNTTIEKYFTNKDNPDVPFSVFERKCEGN